MPACGLIVGTCLQKDPGSLLSQGLFQCFAGLTTELLQGVPAGLPDSKLLDYWATLSSCLTGLDLNVDRSDATLLQPAYLKELTRLTWLSFYEEADFIDNAEQQLWPPYAFEFPGLIDLDLSNLRSGDMDLKCPQLCILSIQDCIMGQLRIQASLKDLCLSDSTYVLLREGFPMSNLSGLTRLRLDGNKDTNSEAFIFQQLPLMTLLQFLHLGINLCSLPSKLPGSLRDLTLLFRTDRAWDSSVIPLVQQLPRVESIRISIRSQHGGSIGVKSLDHDLRPFLAMSSLRLLQFSKSLRWDENASQLWKASTLRQLGELEAEVVRLGKKLQLRY